MYQSRFDPDTKIWSGMDLSGVYNPNISIGQAALWVMQRNPDRIAQISHNSGVELTNAELRIRVIRIAQHILELGFQEDDMFTIIARNNENLAPIVFAAMSIGCPVNTLDPSFSVFEVTHMLRITQPKLIFCEYDKLPIVRKSVSELNSDAMIFTFDKETEYSRCVDELMMETGIEDTFVPVKIADGQQKTAAIVCSSGTTGVSKGVCLSHAALMDRLSYFLPFGFSDVCLCYSSLYWLSGLATLISATLCESTRVITTGPFSPESFFEIVAKYKVSFVISPPVHLSLLVQSGSMDDSDLSSIRYFVSVGSKLSDDLYEAVQAHLPNGNLYCGYGMSEKSGMITLNCPIPKPSSVGLLSTGYHMKIVDENGDRCGINEDGEIGLKSNFKFLGYYDNEEITSSAFDSDGWFLTGDIGHCDEDGYLYIVDRKKDLLKYCNYQVSPTEIESILLKHPGIKQVTVIGIPDPASTELPAAVIVKHDDVDVSADEVMEMVADQLSDAKRLRGGVYFVDCLPMTPSGKVIRRLVLEYIINLL